MDHVHGYEWFQREMSTGIDYVGLCECGDSEISATPPRLEASGQITDRRNGN